MKISRYLSLIICISLVQTTLSQESSTARTATGFVKHESPPANAESVYKFYEETFGFVPNLAKVMASSPALLRSYNDTQNNLKAYGKLSQEEINVVQMAIAVENKCEYCTAGHTMVGQAFFKTPMEVMQCVRNREPLKTAKLNELRNFSIRVYMSRGELKPEDFNKFLQAGYTRDQALDVVACVSAKVMSNYANSLAKTPLDKPLQPLAQGLKFAGN